MSGENSIILNRNIILSFPRAISKEVFIRKIKESANNLIDFLKNNGCNNLARIKYISTTNGEDYLQLSVTDIEQGPRIEGILRKTFEKIKLTLNIIVFGMEKDDISSKISEELRNLEDFFHNA
jgi:hypothetical protein